ncbi:MAG: hypothetical protein V3T17_09870 [Pseudomonadales bacterium]
MLKTLITTGLILLSGMLLAQTECDRSPRTVIYTGESFNVYVANKQAPEVEFPETRLTGLYLEHPENFELDSRAANKITLIAHEDGLHSIASVDGGSGKTYLFRLIDRPGCADWYVKVELPKPVLQHQLARNRKGNIKSLMHHLFKGKRPNGYRLERYTEYEDKDRMVMEMGSVIMLIAEQWIGPKYTGTTYEIVNRGRSGFKFATDALDYYDDNIKASLGKVREISMYPLDRTLTPAPEYVSDLYSGSHRGLVFVVSENVK